VALLRIPNPRRVRAALAALLVGSGCAAPRPPELELQAAAPEPAQPRACLVLASLPSGCSSWELHWNAGRLREAVESALVQSGRFRVIQQAALGSRDVGPAEARNLATVLQAEVVALFRLEHLALRTKVHHVRRYHDVSATGSLSLVEARTGAILDKARETLQISVRARYANEPYACDLLVARLAQKLTGEVLRRGG